MIQFKMMNYYKINVAQLWHTAIQKYDILILKLA